MGKEKSIENKVKKYLKEKGAYFVKVHGGFYGTLGTPDLLVCYNGFFIGIEMKAPGEPPTKIQSRRIEQIKKAGGIAIVADSLEDVQKAVERAGRIGKLELHWPPLKPLPKEAIEAMAETAKAINARKVAKTNE